MSSSTLSGAIPSQPSPQIQVVIDFLASFGRKDFETIASLASDDYVHYVLPKTLGIPPSEKTPWLKSTQEMLGIFNNDFKLDIEEIVEGQNAVIIHAESSATTTTGAKYNNEYVIIFELKTDTEGAVKIKRAKEFVNSKFTAEFFAAERARQAARNKDAV
ncbi:hypothetical protein QCA50_004064 [Cerrena zonata]|uniref:SnoaL-like domain-containing protein n=1 Tax=Cerrena zonata TaxID=2478898 RepID=A0AAW0GSD4_9APHY